jgi:hypothetical protein
MPQLGAAASTETLMSNCSLHRATFVCNGATPVVVVDPAISLIDIINVSLNTVGGTVGAIPRAVTITPNVGFTIAGTAADTSVYNIFIIRGTP